MAEFTDLLVNYSWPLAILLTVLLIIAIVTADTFRNRR